MEQQVDDSELMKRFTAECAEIKDQPFILETDIITAWALLAQIQLALRHPKNTGSASKIAVKIAHEIIDKVAPPGTARREVAEMGWNKQYDTPSGE